MEVSRDALSRSPEGLPVRPWLTLILFTPAQRDYRLAIVRR
jgi:hypothetical protein